MSIDPRYTLATSLQEPFVDKSTGLPLVNGTIYFWQDNNRTVLQPVYEISGSPPNYSFSELTNPIYLGPAGTPVDENGNDILIYYYPYDITGNVSLYYIQVFDSNNVLQFTREGFPSGITSSTQPTQEVDFTNFVVNGTFLFNIGATANPIASNVTVLAPGPNNGFTLPDIYLNKNNTSANDNIVFNQFALGANPVPSSITPTYYLTYTCSNIAAGETFKEITFPIFNSVEALTNQTVTVSFLAKSANGNTLSVNTIQGFGSDPSASALLRSTIETFTLTSTWTEYNVAFTVPNVTGKTLGDTGDDYIALALGLERNAMNSTDITNVQMIEGNNTDIPYIFQPSQIIAGQVFTPRTGDVKLNIRNPDPSWIIMNNGTIGNSGSSATNLASVQSFQLYRTLWDNIDSKFAPLFDSSGAFTARGTSATADFLDGNVIALTSSLGKALAGANPDSERLVSIQFTVLDQATAKLTLLYGNNKPFEIGTRIRFSNSGGSLPTGLLPATTYYAFPFGGSGAATIQVAATLADAISGTPVTLSSNGTGINTVFTILQQTTSLGAYTGEESHTMIPDEIAEHNHVYDDATLTSTGGTISGPILYSVYHNPSDTGATTSNVGINAPFNVIQPTLYLNVYIKL